MPDPRLAFVLGTGRCGSTLVHEVLARHPEVGFLSNVEDRLPWVRLPGRWNGALYRRVPPSFTRKGRLRFAPSEGYRILDRQVSPILSVPCRDLTAEDVTPWLDSTVRSFFGARSRAQGKPMFLHKFTGWPRAGFLQRIFPEARFIHVIRDGRAVANSLLQMDWWPGYRGPSQWTFGPLPEAYAREWEASGRSFAVLAGLEWKLLMDAFEDAKVRIPPVQWMDVRYEDFVADPRRRMAEMLDFVGLRWTEGFEAAFARYSFDPSRRESYRTDLGIHDVRMLDECLAPTLSKNGYRVGRRESPGVEIASVGGG